MRTLRRLHLLLGCFFTPLLLFFVLTGWYQTFNPDRTKAPGEDQWLAARLRTVHVDQIYPTPTARSYHPRSFRWLVGAMAGAMVLTALLGVVLAVRSLRPRWLVGLCIGAGVGVPILLLWLGQRG
jgi:hypothetical protein